MKIQNINPRTKEEKMILTKEIICYGVCGFFAGATAFVMTADFGEMSQYIRYGLLANCVVFSLGGIAIGRCYNIDRKKIKEETKVENKQKIIQLPKNNKY